MTATEIAAKLAERAPEVATLLFPNGRRSGNCCVVGSLDGEAGNSLSVVIVGPRAGTWKDFAGDPDDSGDLIGLWQAVKHVALRQACIEALEFLGISDEPPKLKRPAPATRTFVRPPTDELQPLCSGGAVFDYLTKERGLSLAVLDRYRVRQIETSLEGPTVVFPTRNLTGETVCLKYLAVKRKPDGKKIMRTSKDSEHRLFGWQGIEPEAREIVLTEGEVDCLTVAAWGFNALSLPSGVDSMDWIDLDWDDLSRVDRIFLSFDSDTPGQKAAETVALRLGIERCWWVKLPYKDANECLKHGMTADGFRAVLDAATGFDPAALKGATKFTEEVIAHELAGSIDPKGTQCPFNIPFRIRDGEFTILTGFSGHGKSLVLSQMIAADIGAGLPCCIASLEIKPRKTLWILSRQLLGTMPKDAAGVREVFAWMDGKVWIFDAYGSVNATKIFEAFGYAARRYGVKRFVIDSLLFCGLAEDDYNGQKNFVESYMRFCQHHDVHGFLVCHSRKKEDETFQPGKFDVRGGAAITDAAWNVISVWRNKAKNDAMILATSDSQRNEIANQPDGGLRIWKQRETGDEPAVSLWLNQTSGQFLCRPDELPRRYIK